MAYTSFAELKAIWQGIKTAVEALKEVTAHTFHDAAIVPGDGTALAIGGAKTLLVEIWGTSTSRIVEFKAAGPEGTYRPIIGIRLSDLFMATSTTGTGEFWQFDVTGLIYVIMDLTSVSGGDVTIKGRLVT